MTQLQLFDALPAHIEDALRASIQRFGVLVPVVKDQHGRILDGHHRARIADQLGVKYRVDVVRVADEDEAREIARTLNADRRQLTEEQRRAVAADLFARGHSETAVATVIGVSQPTAHRIKAQLIQENKLCQPERSVGLDGRSRPARRPTVVAAKNEREAERAQQALATLGEDLPSSPVLDVKRVERIARETAAERRRAEPIEAATIHTGSIDIRLGDFREVLADIPDGTVDAIITDPPYPDEYIPLFGDLSVLASRILKPDGVLAVMTGVLRIREWMAQLDKSMKYRWVGAYVMAGQHSRVFAARVANGWKPILIYQRNDAADLPWILDDVFDASTSSDAIRAREFHHWGQAATGIAAIVNRLTKPGALVVDPFLGGGTTAVVCRDLGRRFIGCDIDPASVAISRERIG